MNPLRETHLRLTTRRQFLGNAGQFSLGAIAMNALNGPARASVGDNPLAPRRPQYGAKAKRVIYLHMSGAPPETQSRSELMS